MTTPFGIHGTAELCDEAASALDALLAERDAARADLKEAVGLFEKVLIVYPVQHHYHDEMDSFVKRVGKQP